MNIFKQYERQRIHANETVTNITLDELGFVFYFSLFGFVFGMIIFLFETAIFNFLKYFLV